MQIALHRVAAFLGEEGELLLGLDALGDDRHFEAVAEADHGADDRGRLRIAAEIDDEGAVDLDLVERERLQIAQRGIAAAEIVHRDAHAERLQPPQQRQAAVEILDQHALGDFELEPARREPGLEQDRMHEADQSPCMNCAGDRLTAICSGFGHDAASRQASRRIHSPISTIRPLSSASGMNSPGEHEAAHRMHPARQRLEADDLAARRRCGARCACGWKCSDSSPFLIASDRSWCSTRRSRICWSISGSIDADRAARFLPWRGTAPRRHWQAARRRRRRCAGIPRCRW